MTEHTPVEQRLLDIRGQICPSTLLTTLRQVNINKAELQGGRLCLVILTDHRDATATIPDMVKNMGYMVLVSNESGYYRIEISHGQ